MASNLPRIASPRTHSWMTFSLYGDLVRLKYVIPENLTTLYLLRDFLGLVSFTTVFSWSSFCSKISRMCSALLGLSSLIKVLQE